MFSNARGKAKHELSRCRVFSTNSDGVHDELVYVKFYFEFISTNAFFVCAPQYPLGSGQS